VKEHDLRSPGAQELLKSYLRPLPPQHGEIQRTSQQASIDAMQQILRSDSTCEATIKQKSFDYRTKSQQDAPNPITRSNLEALHGLNTSEVKLFRTAKRLLEVDD
jgi:hypothetical protein